MSTTLVFQLCPGEHESLRDGLDFGESCVPIPFIRLALGLDYIQCVYPYTHIYIYTMYT